jgi:hypothetical protein
MTTVIKQHWKLDDGALITPAGRRIPLAAIEDWAMAAWGGRQHIVTAQWTGWRIVQQYLVPPGSIASKGIPLLAVRHLHLERRGKQQRVWRT